MMLFATGLAESFDSLVEDTLMRLGCLDVSVIGAAVSGGADSVAMLVSFCHIARKRGFAVKAITVNHNIRKEEETLGDVKSVEALCKRLFEEGFPVSVCVETLPKGEVAKTAQKRGRGEEEAARFLRYRAFQKTAEREGLKYIATAHNQNDNLETILMHFLTGSQSGGVQEARIGDESKGGCTFVRPLLKVTRGEIERYLAEQGIAYRTDKTNYDTRYFRNKIRHSIVPVLDEAVPGWKKAVLSGSEKARDDGEALDDAAKAVCIQKEDGQTLSLKLETFEKQSRAIKRRLVLRLFDELGADTRVPYAVISSIIEGIDKASESDLSFKQCCAQVEIGVRGEGRSPSAPPTAGCIEGRKSIYAKKVQKTVTDSGYCVIIKGAGCFETPVGTLDVEDDGALKVSVSIGRSNVLHGLPLPLCVRTRNVGDEVVTAQGTHKSVYQLMSDWKVNKMDRERIPIVTKCPAAGGVYRGEEVLCVWGSVLGYGDYLVEGGRQWKAEDLLRCVNMRF